MAKPKDLKQIQLTINKLTKAQYDSIAPAELSTKYADQLFMTTDDAGRSGSTVQVSAVQTSGTKIAVISVDNLPTDIYAPDDYAKISALSRYAALSGGNSISGNNDISVLNIVRTLSAANNFHKEDSLEDKSLIMTDETGSYNVNYSQLNIISANDSTNGNKIIRALSVVSALPSSARDDVIYFVKASAN